MLTALLLSCTVQCAGAAPLSQFCCDFGVPRSSRLYRSMLKAFLNCGHPPLSSCEVLSQASAPLLKVRSCRLQVDCRHQPSFFVMLCSFKKLVLPQRYLLKHWNETSTYKHVPKLQSRVLSLATVIMLACGEVPFAQPKSGSYMFCCDGGPCQTLWSRTVSLRVEGLSHDRSFA